MRRRQSTVASVIVAAGVGMAGAALAQSHIEPGAIVKIEQRLAREAQEHPVGGMTVGLVEGGKLVWIRNYGFADMERHVAPNADTVYRIGSVTKQFTSIMLLQLVEAGKVKVSDSVQQYLPEIARVKGAVPGAASITLEQLASHKSGLAREPDEPQFVAGPTSAWKGTLLAAISHVNVQFAPGARVFYSNIGVGILGAALSNAAGQPYIGYVQSHIISPLGMQHTSFEPDKAMLTHLAPGYRIKDGVGDPSAARSELEKGRGYKIPNGGLFSTVGDLAKFVSFEMGYGPAKVLDPVRLGENFALSYPMEDEPGWRYGRGFYATQVNGQTILGHWGSVTGYAAAAYFDPDAKVGVVILRNADPRISNELIVDVLQLAIGKQAPPQK